jgi:hypothetical protein
MFLVVIFVTMWMAFFCVFIILLMLDVDAQLTIMGQYVKCEWMSA